MKTLVVYGTIQGQSGKIAQAIAAEVKTLGHTVEVWDSVNIPSSLQVRNFDSVVLGGGVHASGYPKALVKWVKKDSKELNDIPSAFYSVCLGILQKDDKVQAEEEKIIQEFFKKTGWTPATHTIFAGALTYSKYNWFLKRIMRSISRKAGGETDMTRDYEYTDWEKVKLFAKDFVFLAAR